MVNGGVTALCRVRTGRTRAETVRQEHMFARFPAVVRNLSDGTSLIVTYLGGAGSSAFGRADALRLARDIDVSPVFTDPSTWLIVR